MFGSWLRPRPLAAMLVLATGLAGCVNPQGIGPAADGSRIQPKRVGDFSVDFANEERAVFVAKGQTVEIRPAEGFCIAPESVDVGPASGFAMLGDCPAETAAGSDGSRLSVPRAIPAMMTISIAEEPMFGPDSRRGRALGDLEKFLATDEGLATVGRSGKTGSVSIVETRPIGDALYVHVEDRDVSALPMLGSRFWRAFFEVNERMVLVSLSGFSDGPLPSDQMLAHLAAQVSALRQANGMAVPAEEARIAATARIDGPSMVAVNTVGAPAPAAAPLAPARPDGDGGSTGLVEVAAFDGDGSGDGGVDDATPAGIGGATDEDVLETTIAIAAADADRSAALLPLASVMPAPRPAIGGADEADLEVATSTSPHAPAEAPRAPVRRN